VWAVNPKNDSLASLLDYLCRFAEDLFEGTAVQCSFELPGEIPDVELPTEVRHHMFLAVKEALNNAFKHAQARQMCLRFKLTGGVVRIEIEDDGSGGADAEACKAD